MYLIVTRSFPPELGGMQSLMWGLARELSKNFMIKVFADYIENHKEFDEQATFSIERVGGPKLLRKYRKAYLIDEFIKNGKVNGIIADHWKSLEHLKTNKKKYCLIHGKDEESDLLTAMRQIAETGKGPEDQIPSAGCSIKWKYD